VDNEEFSFVVGLLRTFGVKYFSLAILRFLADLLTFAGPILLHLLVEALQLGDPRVSTYYLMDSIELFSEHGFHLRFYDVGSFIQRCNL
jgi:hypothetical protein